MTGQDPVHEEHTHDGNGDHGHDHPHDPHAPSPDDPLPTTEWEFLEKALSELLSETGVFSEADIQRQMDFMDSRNAALGAKVVARAVKPEERLLNDLLRQLVIAQVPARET